MRFAWLQKNAANEIPAGSSAVNRLILAVYNIVWWVPIVLTILGTIDPITGMIAFAVITLIRAIANGYRVNVLPLEQAVNFPLRTP